MPLSHLNLVSVGSSVSSNGSSSGSKGETSSSAAPPYWRVQEAQPICSFQSENGASFPGTSAVFITGAWTRSTHDSLTCTRTRTQSHWRWSISVSYCKWFLNEWIELYIIGTQAKVFSDYMRLQGANIICAQGALLLSYFAPCKCGRGCFVNLTPSFPRRLSGVEVTGVSRFIQPQPKTKDPTENDHLTVVGAQRQF